MKKLLLVCGGQSSEHSVSRMSCTSVLNNIHKDLYEITVAGIDKDGTWYRLSDTLDDFSHENWLENAEKVVSVLDLITSQDVVFPVLHGLYGEDGTIQGMCEMVHVPYVGCRVFASSVCMDKIYAKKVFAHAGIPQVKSVFVRKRYDGKMIVVDDEANEHENVTEYIKETIGFPAFVKASRSGSSVGCYKCHTEEKLQACLSEASQYDRHIVVEQFCDCIELETAVLGNDDIIVSRVGEIMPHGEFYTFESKYEDAESKTCIPARVDIGIQETIRALAVRAFRAVDGHGFARVDFFLDKNNGNIYLNEINTIPGFTKISMYPQLMADAGISYSELIDRLIALAFER